MNGLSILFFALTCIGNVAGVALLTASNGLTKPLPTLGVVASYAIGVWALSRLIVGGGNISLLVPLMAVFVPLMSIAIGVAVLHEPASWPRIGLLLASCALIGIAARV